jgi:anti-sigma factor RsiW
MNDRFDSQIARPDSADRCGWVRDLLPLRRSGAGDPRFAEVEGHLAGCADCRAEAEFVDRLRQARPEPPAGLVEATLKRYAERPRGSVRKLRWGGPLGVSAAAVVAALGLGLFAMTRSAADPLWSLALDSEPAAWYGEEWIVAGGPVPEALSDDELLLLLEEMDQ